MQRVFRLPFLLLIVGVAGLILKAQQTSRRSANAPPRSFSLLVPEIPTIAGAPFTAKYEIQVQRTLDDSGSEIWRSVTRVARDSRGRIWHELHDYVPASFTQEPPLQSVVITDPISRLRHTLDPVRQIDDRQWFHVSQSNVLQSGRSAGRDLGTRIMNGLKVKGELRNWTTLSRSGASGQADRVVDEIWYSDKWHFIVFEQQKDSAGEVFTIAMSKPDRSEPRGSLFKVPRGYHLPISPRRNPMAPAIDQPNYDPSVGSSAAW